MVHDRAAPQGAEPQLVWVQNWFEELRAKMER